MLEEFKEFKSDPSKFEAAKGDLGLSRGRINPADSSKFKKFIIINFIILVEVEANSVEIHSFFGGSSPEEILEKLIQRKNEYWNLSNYIYKNFLPTLGPEVYYIIINHSIYWNINRKRRKNQKNSMIFIFLY